MLVACKMTKLMLTKCSNREVSISQLKQLFKTLCTGKFMQLPMNRVRQIINMDEESIMVSKEALLLITKATEHFVSDLAGVCA